MNTYINKGDWIVKNSKEVYDNPWITVRHYNVITPEIPEIRKMLINQDTLKSLNDFSKLFLIEPSPSIII